MDFMSDELFDGRRIKGEPVARLHVASKIHVQPLQLAVRPRPVLQELGQEGHSHVAGEDDAAEALACPGSALAASSLVNRPIPDPQTVVKASNCSLVGSLTTEGSSSPGSTSWKYGPLIAAGPFGR